ncbi:acid phosphatase [Lichenicola sp.]|uniref:acid phosphatase n=1 Tax=Lichenicola sp. TaxID=2804529 RepID=UPI003AFFD293
MSLLARIVCVTPLALALTTAMAMAQSPPGGPGGGMSAPTPGVAAKRERLPPGTYISGATLPDTTLILPPPPLPGSPEQAADDAVFRQSRALRDTPRWTLAQNDAHLATSDLLADFACALGFTIDPKRAPALMSLLDHAGADMGPELDRTKNLWQRHRPYIGNTQPICVQRHGSLDDNPSYPSGHTTLEFGASLILAELVPDRAAELIQRGRTMSESRLVCGVHWLSDVQAGFLEAASLVAALHGSETFRADLDRARAEIATLRAGPSAAPDTAACRVQADAASHSLLFRLQPADRQ